MAITLTLRTFSNPGDTTKGAPLTNTQVDENFVALKNNKLDLDGSLTMTGKLTLAVSSTSLASIKLSAGSSDPSSPASGDLWNNTGTLKFYNGSSNLQLITASTSVSNGQLLIGNASTNKFVAANLTGTSDQITATSGAGSITLSTPQNIATTSAVQFGSLGLGTTAGTSGTLKIQTSIAVGAITPSATTGRIDAENDVVAFSTSDERMKTNIQVIDDALAKVCSLRGVTFTWDELQKEHHGYEGQDTGVIAQDVVKVLPEVVTTRDNGFMAVKYEKMIGLLIEAIKELNEKVENCSCNK